MKELAYLSLKKRRWQAYIVTVSSTDSKLDYMHTPKTPSVLAEVVEWAKAWGLA